jgi:hypothetical protein
LLKLERIKDFLLMEEEFIQNQERFKPQEEKTQDEITKVDDIRGSPMAVGSIEEIIDDNHAIVSSSVGPEYYVPILSFVDKDLIEPGCSVLLHNKVMAVVGILQDEVDPLVSVMKVEKAPLETYADIGGLEKQIQEIKVCLRFVISFSLSLSLSSFPLFSLFVFVSFPLLIQNVVIPPPHLLSRCVCVLCLLFIHCLSFSCVLILILFMCRKL